ncbi:MAG: GAF domain-containing sensor histidine kinase, partial [Armatimonadetes bacterium]|nr:GAF domain-containing sensor histidine kinase [Armatimonadota bacterium]
RATCEAAGRLISSLLNQLTTALELRQQADMRARRLAILADVSHTVTESLDLLRVLDAVVQAVPRVMPAKAAAVALLDDDGHALRIRAGYGLSEEFMQVRFVPGKGLLGHVVVTGEVINAPDMLAEPRNAYAEHDRRAGLRALVAVPLRDGDRLIGVVAAFHDQPHSFTGGDQQVLEALANYAATAVRNARLYARVTQAYRELGVATRRLHDVQERLFHSDRLAMLGRLAGDTAHEMKNTLGGIIGAASTVRDQLEQLSDDDIRELVAAIAEEGWRLRDTIEAVRGYSKPGHYGGGAHSLAETIADAVRLLRFDHALMDLPFETTCPADLRFVGDRDRVKQVLINLLRNAVEALREVTNREPRIEVSGEAAGEMVRIKVSDNGVGIPAERIERIWEPFYTTKGVAGTGIGLDTVRQIVRAQGGEVEVTSEPGVGTTFTILLPRVREDEDEA